jgi:polysulfide reductase chain C
MFEITWGMPVVIYLFLAGLGAGSFCLGALTSRKSGPGWEYCSRVAFLLAPPAIAIGLLMLILDLGYKTRFWRVLTVLNPGSPMSVGVWLLCGFLLISILCAIFWLPVSARRQIPWIGRLSIWNQEKWSRRFAIMGIPFALGVSVYTGVLLSATVIPLWRNLSLPVLFFFSALSLGIESGAVLGIASLNKGDGEVMKQPLRFLRRSNRVILPLYLLAALLFVFSLALSSHSKAAAYHLMTGWSGFAWWIGVIGLGIILPLVMVIRKESKRYAWIFSSCLLFGDFMLRLVLVLAGQAAM